MTKPIDYRTICKKCGKPHYHLPTEVYQLCDNCHVREGKMKQDKVERQKPFEIDVTLLTSEMLGRAILSRLETSRALVVPIYEGDNSMDKVEQVKRILAPICHERAMSLAYKVNQIESLAEEMSTNLSKQIVVLFEPASPNRPKIVCLCSSGRFKEACEQAEFNETLSGKIVLTIGCNTKDIARSDLASCKPMLDELHLRKIDLSDEVLILNVGGYIGESVKRELEYAKEHGKQIRFLEPVNRS